VTGISQSPDYFDASVDLDLTQLLDQEDKNDGVALEVKPKNIQSIIQIIVKKVFS